MKHQGMRRVVGSLGCVTAMMLATPAAGQGRSEAPVDSASIGVAMRTATAPRLDGHDDDAVWQHARVIRGFELFAPREGGPPDFATEARVLYDDRNLYVLVRAFDPSPDSIVRRLARRDTDGPPNDQILLFIDSFHDRRTGYQLMVNPAGVKSDYLLSDDEQSDQSWDGVWEVETAVDSLGWVAEFAIPFQQLRFSDRAAPEFGFLVGRWVGRTDERASWPQYRRSRAGLVSQLGTLTGLRDLSGSSGLTVVPYALLRSRNVLATPSSATELQTRPALGGDLKWLPKPSLAVDATFNPDFGQIDADPAILNLTGLEIHQPERRPFFLEGAGLLTLPLAADGSGQLFYSRRIGRRPALVDQYGASDSPTETTILGAGRVTARLTPTSSVALLSALTSEERGRVPSGGSAPFVIEPRAHHGVARYQRDFRGGRSGLGLMLTRVDRSARDSNTAGVLPSSAQALAVTTQHQSADGAYQAIGWLATSDVRGEAGAIERLQLSLVRAYQRPDDGVDFDPSRTALRGSAGYVSFGKVGGGRSRYSASYRRIAPGFDVNESGFLTIAGVQTVATEVGVLQTTPGHALGVPFRRSNLTFGFGGSWTTDGLALKRGVTLNGSMQLMNQGQLQATLKADLPGAYCTVSCTRGGPAMVDPPQYALVLDATGNPRRTLVPHLNFTWDRDDEGRSRGVGAQVDLLWRIRSNLDASLAAFASNARHGAHYYARFGDALSDTAHFTVARLDQPTRSLTARTNYAVTRTLTLQWYAQAYVSRGAFRDIREIVAPRAREWGNRFEPYADTSVTGSPGGIDFKQLRSNLVVRWEYRTGSALFLVWSQGRDFEGSEAAEPGLWPGRDFRQLLSLRPSNTVALKVSYWWSR